jgi:hypothetical protein
VNATAGQALALGVAGASLRLRTLLGSPGAAQREQLARIVCNNRRSRFGQAHDFASIGDAAGYARQVPVRRYEELQPWIDAAAGGEVGALTEEAIVAFEETGGSTAGRRLVPYTAAGLNEFQRGLHAWLDDLLVALPALAQGRFYWSISPAGRAPRITASGIAVGLASDAAYFGDKLAPAIHATLAVPAAVAACKDIREWRRDTLAHLVACEDLSMISVWSPTFLSSLLSSARGDLDELARRCAGLPACDSRRTDRALRELADRQPDFARIWPRLALISCWDQAGAHGPAQALRDAFPRVHVQGKGLLATEALVSLPLHDQPYPVLALQSGYFEFRDAAGAMHTVETVQDEAEYELVVSNASGLYRYLIGDRVRVRGFAGRTPRLEFCGRDGGADLCGEKLTEAFVLRALAPHALRFGALAADAAAMRYVLLLDATETPADAATELAAQVECALHRNPQYAHARLVGQLDALAVVRCPDPQERWTALRLQAGQRLGDIKPPVLIVDDAARRRLES